MNNDHAFIVAHLTQRSLSTDRSGRTKQP